MRTPVDALRSVKKFTADALPEFEVRLAKEEGTFVRPFARVGFAGSIDLPKGQLEMVDYIVPMFVHCYPERAATGEQAVVKSLELADRVGLIFRSGPHPYRVPFYDYEGVSLDRAGTERASTDFIRLSDVSVETQVDSDEQYLTFVTVDIRATWRRHMRLTDGDPLAGSNILGTMD